MAIAIDPQGERTIITEGDLKLPEDQQVEWKITDLSERQRVAFMDSLKLVDDGSGRTAIGGQGTRIYVALKGGLKGYTDEKPLRDSEGNLVPFEKSKLGEVSDTFLERIIWTEKVAIADYITESIALLEEDTEK